MCVKSPMGWMIAAHIIGSECPIVGDTLTVKDKYKSPCCNGSHEVYDFEEYDLLKAFDARCFAILPDADADEIEDAQKEAIVPAPSLYGNEHLHPIFQNILNSFISH
jgi:hypothetical protein